MDLDIVLKITYYVFFGLFGVCIGSFLNVVIYRWPNNMSIVSPPSHCPNCGYKLQWFDNIPVISYILLGGKCRNCKEHISFRYTLVEISNMLLWILCLALNHSNIPLALIYSLICSIFICIFFIDIEHKIILDRFNIAIIVLAIISIFFLGPKSEWLSIGLNKLIGGIVGGGFFLLAFYISILVFKKEGLGGGDVKFMFSAGLLLGWKNILLAVFIASLSGSIIMLILQKVRSDEKDHEYPFAPYLVAGSLISLFFGDFIINSYLSLIGII